MFSTKRWTRLSRSDRGSLSSGPIGFGPQDGGSAPVEFLAFGLPAVLVLLAALQMLLSGYVSNVAFDAAVEGSAQAAAADGSLEAGVARAAEVMEVAAPWLKPSISATDGSLAGEAASGISVSAPGSFLNFAVFRIEMEAWSINERS